MRKTDKKIENALRRALTTACDVALEKHAGFKWLTHFANYQLFPDSLCIVCVFDTNEQLSNANKEDLHAIIKDQLTVINVHVKDIRAHVSFDTEENCAKASAGRWHERLRQIHS